MSNINNKNNIKDIIFKVVSNKKVSKGVFLLNLHTNLPLPSIKAGQFVNLSVKRADLILRRPFCVFDFDGEEGILTLIYAVVGEGTLDMSKLKRGDMVNVLLPLGNGFSEVGNRKAAFVGGGMGCACINLLAKQGGISYLGFDTAKTSKIFEERLGGRAVRLATVDGSAGHKGFPTDLLRADIEEGNAPDIIFVCGPIPLVRAVKEIAVKYSIPCEVSMEARMGCGFGVCLVCTCAVNGENKRVCVDGTVFNILDIDLDSDLEAVH